MVLFFLLFSFYYIIICWLFCGTLCDFFDLFQSFFLFDFFHFQILFFLKQVTFCISSKFSDGRYSIGYIFRIFSRLDAFKRKKSNGNIAFGCSHTIPIMVQMLNSTIKRGKLLEALQFYRDADGRLAWKKENKTPNKTMLLQRVLCVCAVDWQALPFNKCYPHG